MRCPRCGNENSEGNRFCGMCGATMLAPSPPAPVHPAAQPVRPAAPPIPEQTPALNEPTVATRVEEEAPSIAGPSFLGLNDPAPSKRASLSIDPHSSQSSNLDYLLEDTEEPKGGGAGKVFLILLALLLAVGFGYLRFRSHGFPWASVGANKPAAQTSPDTSSSTGTTETSAPASPSITPEPPPATNQSVAPSQPASTPAANPPATQPPAQPSTPTTSSAANADKSPASANPAPATKTTEAGSEASNAQASATTKPDDANASDNASPDSSAAAPPAEAPATKPRAAVRPVDMVAEAQRYVYGKGVTQDCDRGLRILKPVANQGNPKAMVEMGALYSAGLCTPRDLPTAYRWFALALRKDPSNESIQTDLQKLWSEMTQPERQLAIKLTQ